jgi:hypothetical protein
MGSASVRSGAPGRGRRWSDRGSRPEPESKRKTVTRVTSKPIKSDSDTAAEKHPLQASKDSYLAEVKDHKTPKTQVAYREAPNGSLV